MYITFKLSGAFFNTHCHIRKLFFTIRVFLRGKDGLFGDKKGFSPDAEKGRVQRGKSMRFEHPTAEHDPFSFSHRNRVQIVKQTAIHHKDSDAYSAQKSDQIRRYYFTHFPEVCKNETISALCKIKAKMEVTKRYYFAQPKNFWQRPTSVHANIRKPTSDKRKEIFSRKTLEAF